ncbi:MAG: cytochrome C [Sphingomonas taxi]|uniref:Cytochrome C n=1 Tax=Sphingomonas taxi TaxID=1549858 RepID=A0A2W4Z402_9SPHN|nr:MAG: cytochrome C [Sphingomonas taxi]
MTIRITWARAIATLVALALAGLLFAWSGVFNIAASSGHWKITDWFLHWTMRNSVRTYAAVTVPDDPKANEGLVSAAGHFKASCASCHGAPGVRPLPVMQAATPPAPDLSINAREWTDKQIFWILKHGVKYTGMPGWAAKDCDDEVRRMVAFVRLLPEMSPATYRSLTEVPGIADAKISTCAGCHGADGQGRGQPDMPVLGGQSPAYLRASLEAYATGKRRSAVMANAAATLTPTEMTRLADHFAAMPGIGGVTPSGSTEAAKINREGLPKVQLPACASCHAPGKPYPVLAGQRASYIAQRLRNWRGDETVVDARKSQATMPVIARRIPEDMIDPLARYLAGR